MSLRKNFTYGLFSLLALGVLCSTNLLVAQEGVLPLNSPDYDLHYRLWTIDDGLPHWKTELLLTDRQEVVWLLCDNLLTQFDGEHFRVVDTINLPNSPRPTMVEDRAGQLWFSDGYELWRYDPCGEFTWPFSQAVKQSLYQPHYGQSPPLCLFSLDDEIYLFDRGRVSNRLWKIGEDLELVFEATNEQKVRQGNQPLPVTYLPTKDHLFWQLRIDLGPLLIDRRGEVIEDYSELLPGPNNFIYHGGELYTYKNRDAGWDGEVPIRPLRSGVPSVQNVALTGRSFDLELYSKAIIPGNHVFFPEAGLSITNQGNPLLVERGKAGAVQLFEQINKDLGGVASVEVVSQTVMSWQWAQQSVMMAMGQGLVQLRLQPKPLFNPTISPPSSIRSIAFLEDQTCIYVTTTNSEKLQVLDLANGGRREAGRLSSSETFYSVRVDEDYLFAGRYNGGLELYDHDLNWLAYHEAPDSPWRQEPIECRSPVRVRDSLVYYGTRRGIVRLNISTGSSQFILRDRNCLWIHEDRNGSLWAGTESGLYHLGNQKTYLDSLRGKPLRVEHIYEDKSGDFWLSTFSGLLKWRPYSETYEQYNLGTHFRSEEIHAAYPDDHGMLWLSSNDGIMAFDPSSQMVTNYGRDAGLLNSEQNFLAHTRGPDGHLYFGGLGGIVAVDPGAAAVKMTDIAPSLILRGGSQIDAMGIQKKAALRLCSDGSSGLLVDAGATQIEVELQLINHHQKRYVTEWRVKGFSPSWTRLTNPRLITISGIPNGHNELQLRVREQSNLHNAHAFTIPIYRQYYWHQLSGVRLGGGLLFLLSVAFLVWARNKVLRDTNKKLKRQVRLRTRELEESNAMIAAQNKELLLVDRTKSDLLKSISHEFRTPLALIKLYTEQLLGQQKVTESPTCYSSLTKIQQQQRSLQQMTDEFLQLTEFEMGMVKKEDQVVEWNPFFKRVALQFRALAEEKQQDYRFSTEIPEKIFLHIDPTKVERVINNLIQNAIKFTPRSGRIFVKTRLADGTVEVMVADTGPGISADEQVKIFQRYYQSSQTTSDSDSGFGIGLALCEQYAHILKGKLWVESILDRGTTFFFQFPLELATDEEIAESPKNQKGDTETTYARTYEAIAGSPTKGHLLVVEDNSEMREFIQQLLSGEYQVSVANNGVEAWSFLEATSTPVDLVISDVMMPLLDGFSLLQKVRTCPSLAPTPFLIITALDSPGDRLKAFRLGSDGILSKPFSLEELQTQIAALVNNQRLRKSFHQQEPPESGVTSAQASSPGTVEDSELKPYDVEWLEEVDKIIKEQMHRSTLNVNSLAFELNITDRTLRNRLRNFTGVSPSDYIRRARLNHAKILLISNKFSTVAEVAYKVGYNDPKLFARHFRKAFGTLPSELAH